MKAFADVLPVLAVGRRVPDRAVPCGSGASVTPSAPSHASTRRLASPCGPGVHDEASLCRAALQGDAGAWSALVAKHNRRVVVALLARGLRIDRANDVAQETWIRLVEQQRQGRLERLQLPGLAIAQATFLALEVARREGGLRQHQPLDEPAVAAHLADPRGDAEVHMMTEERIARAAEALSRCSPSAKMVFQLVYGGQGLSHVEVAARVGLSLQRVRQILCEVRAKLRGAVQGEEEP